VFPAWAGFGGQSRQTPNPPFGAESRKRGESYWSAARWFGNDTQFALYSFRFS